MHWLELVTTILLLLLLAPPLGNYIASIFSKEPTFLDPILKPLERAIYRLSGVNESIQENWKQYGLKLALFNLIGFFLLLLILLYQNVLPLNPQKFDGVPFLLAVNTAVSFVTNTNWQAYSGETTLSYFSQMVGLTTQNFLSAATGFAALFVLIRGLIRSETDLVGNCFVDLTRITLYILLPLSLLFSLFLVEQGVPETLSPYVAIETLENEKQIIPLGPIASQVAIKQIGSNGGGFFNTNSAHPFENPTPLTNFFEHLAILLLPIASLFTFAKLTGAKKHALTLFFVMAALWLLPFIFSYNEQLSHNPTLPTKINYEGLETRFGPFYTTLWTTSTSATSNGSVNGMISSLSPLSSLIALFNMMLGEVIFGGVGVGLASLLMFVFLTIFLSGLMVGRSPCYLGKKIEKEEMIAVTIAIIAPSSLILLGTTFSLYLDAATSSILNKGPHGLTEILYAFSSASANNGSSFAGLNANTDFYNISLALCMFFGRVAILGTTIALGGFLAKKKSAMSGLCTFSCENLMFGTLLFTVIIITSGLTFLPALSLGPIAEELLMIKGVTF